MMRLLALILTLCALPAQSAVRLYLVPVGDPNPMLSPGQTLSAVATIGSTTEKITGVDYYLDDAPVRVLSRDVSNSLYSDVLATDPTAANVDLGGLLVDVGKPPPPGFYGLSRLLLQVNQDAAAGMYDISIHGGVGYGWSDELFQDHPFTSNGGFKLNVLTPEPQTLGYVYAMLALFLRKKRASDISR